MSSTADKIAALIDAEVKRKTYENMCTAVEKVARLYSIPLKVVRRDLLGDFPYCMGVSSSGKLCCHRAVMEGYCSKHVKDQRPHEPIVMNRGVRHNHVFPSAPREGCPACEINRNAKEFRDLSTIM